MKLQTVFDTIGRAITSLAAVIFALLMIITAMIFFSHTLFMDVFPTTMDKWERITATWLMALGWEFTVLLTTVNTRHINKHIPLVMAIASGFIVLFFIQAFDVSQPMLIVAQRWFVGVLAATINYIYAELFFAKWQERTAQQAMPMQLMQNKSTIDELAQRLIEREQALEQAQRALNERERRLQELERFKKTVDAELTCQHCNTQQASYGALRAHKGHCKNNPINLKTT
jgi:molybdopterin converting factor small subunit